MTRFVILLILGLMKTLVAFLGFVSMSYSTLAFGSDPEVNYKNQYKMSAKIERDGVLLSSPTIIGFDGEEASMEQSEVSGDSSLKLVVKPKSVAKNPNLVRMKISFSHQKDGDSLKFNSTIVMNDSGAETVLPVLSNSGHQYLVHLSAERQ
jgi:hypothetical protein